MNAQHVKVHIDDWTATTDNGQGVTVTEAVSGLKTMLMGGTAGRGRRWASAYRRNPGMTLT